MMIADHEYQSHPIFSELELYISFYKDLSHSVFSFVKPGTRALCNIDTYVFSSMQGTLSSIHLVLKDGMINDAYALLRKYFEATTINIYSNLYLTDTFNIENLVVAQIDKWLKGTDRLPEYRIMSRYIQSSQRVAPMTAILRADDHYKLLRERCNDHSHYNYYHNLLLNDAEILLKTRKTVLCQLAKDLRDVLIYHVAYLFFMNDHYMTSGDYIDALECNMEPEADSQYWVAPYIQQLFDKVIGRHRPDVKDMIVQHTSMQLV